MNLSISKIVVPEYLCNFKCSNLQCEFCCCYNFNVSIDKNTYEKYEKIDDKNIRKEILSNIKSYSSDNHTLKFNHKKACPFLTSDNLCSIHNNFGEDYLSNTCYNYPKTFNVVDNTLEVCATASCIEVAKLMLLKKDGLNFIENPSLSFQRTIIDTVLLTTKEDNGFYKNEHFTILRNLCIHIINTPLYSLDHKLLILGLFIFDLSKIYESENFSLVPSFVDYYKECISNNSLNESLSNLNSSFGIQLKSLLKVLEMKKLHKDKKNSLYEYLLKLYEGISLPKDKKNSKLHYENAYNTYYLPFMKDHEYILENYIINYMFKNLFPLEKTKDIVDQYGVIAMHYSLIKMFLIGISGAEKELNSDMVVKLIQAYSKSIEHDQEYIRESYIFLKESGFRSMDKIALLIKNTN